ncbi:MAG: 3-oxoacyl-ACP reductase, partial [Kocuria rhizophila]
MTTILLTGASRGIGAAARTTLAARGCTVIGQSTAGGDGLLAADFTDPAAPGQLWDAALEQAGGRVDVLVNNAGLFRAAPLDIADAEWSAAWGETLRINLDSAAELSRRAVRH